MLNNHEFRVAEVFPGDFIVPATISQINFDIEQRLGTDMPGVYQFGYTPILAKDD